MISIEPVESSKIVLANQPRNFDVRVRPASGFGRDELLTRAAEIAGPIYSARD